MKISKINYSNKTYTPKQRQNKTIITSKNVQNHQRLTAIELKNHFCTYGISFGATKTQLNSDSFNLAKIFTTDADKLSELSKLTKFGYNFSNGTTTICEPKGLKEFPEDYEVSTIISTFSTKDKESRDLLSCRAINSTNEAFLTYDISKNDDIVLVLKDILQKKQTATYKDGMKELTFPYYSLEKKDSLDRLLPPNTIGISAKNVKKYKTAILQELKTTNNEAYQIIITLDKLADEGIEIFIPKARHDVNNEYFNIYALANCTEI